jgi:N-acetylglucosamine kinase-like BadF-type ATPase
MSAVTLQKPCTICIDGGGTKTALQVIDEIGSLIPVEYNGKIFETVEVGGTNINSNGNEKVQEALAELFQRVTIKGVKLSIIAEKVHVVAGIAGTKSPVNKEIVTAYLQENGVNETQLNLLPDADMALGLIDGDGAIVIAGTGSICMGKKDDLSYRVGGVGPVFAENSSGYGMGLAAFHAALADELGWGEKTTLTYGIRGHFNQPELKNLIPDINSRKMTISQVAEVAKLVTERVGHDAVADEIFNQTVQNITYLLARMVQKSNLVNGQVHLWGGIFRSQHGERIRNAMLLHPVLQGRNLEIVNQADKNVALLYAQKIRATASVGSKEQLK